jgi:hypothetical protein
VISPAPNPITRPFFITFIISSSFETSNFLVVVSNLSAKIGLYFLNRVSKSISFFISPALHTGKIINSSIPSKHRLMRSNRKLKLKFRI